MKRILVTNLCKERTMTLPSLFISAKPFSILAATVLTLSHSKTVPWSSLSSQETPKPYLSLSA